MIKEERSKGACWTCRLRRKKCDELSPACVACTSHPLPCYGYEKPDWADGGTKQKARQKELQTTIREVALGKRLLLKQRMSKPFMDSAISLSEVNIMDANTVSSDEPQFKIGDHTPHHFVEISAMFSYPVGYGNMSHHDPQEDLLAHYLDVVFPSQFPLSSEAKVARGWLLPLLLKVPSLYHAAISIAAFHKDLSGENIGDRNYGSIHQGLALKALRQYLTKDDGCDLAASLESNVEVLASIVLLVSLEVLMGDTENWFIHMKGPLLLLPTLRQACSQRILLSPEHQVGLQFFAGVITWYNALSCVSTTRIPWAPTSCLRTAINGWVSVSAVTGCHNTVAISIIEIAALNVQTKALDSDTLELAATARQIDADLQQWTRAYEISSKTETKSDVLVTRVFATAAQVYLHVIASRVVSDLPGIHTSVCKALTALEAITDVHVLGTLAWPLCITGCMATGWQMDVIKGIFSSIKRVPSLQLGGMERCRRMIEECWRLRQEVGHVNSQFTWVQAMNSLDMKILLV